MSDQEIRWHYLKLPRQKVGRVLLVAGAGFAQIPTLQKAI